MVSDLSVRQAGLEDLDAALPLMQRFFAEESYESVF